MTSLTVNVGLPTATVVMRPLTGRCIVAISELFSSVSLWFSRISYLPSVGKTSVGSPLWAMRLRVHGIVIEMKTERSSYIVLPFKSTWGIVI